MEALASDGFVAHQLRHGKDRPRANASAGTSKAADQEERKRQKEERKNEKMIKRALRAARGAGAGTAATADAGSGDEEVDTSNIDPALLTVQPNAGESSNANAHAHPNAKKRKSAMAKVSVDQFGRPTNEFARVSKKTKQGDSSASANANANASATANGALDIDALREQFKVPGAMEAFLSEKWLSTVQLRQLEDNGLIIVKKGTFSEDEEVAVRAYMKHFQASNHLTDSQLVDLIMSKGRKDAYPRFWYDVGSTLPGRPMRFVQKFVKRLYDSRGRKGKWTKEEDASLMEAFTKTNGSWVRMAESVGRPEEDCRARWRDHLRMEREMGKWTAEDEDALLQAVKEANLALGKDELARDAPWEVVVMKMGGKRTAPQCRKKWHDKLRPTLLGEELYPANGKYRIKRQARDSPGLSETGTTGSSSRVGHQSRIQLIQALNDIQPRPATISSVDWASLAASSFPSHSPQSLAKTFKKAIKEADAKMTMSFDDILAKVSAHFLPSPTTEMPHSLADLDVLPIAEALDTLPGEMDDSGDDE